MTGFWPIQRGPQPSRIPFGGGEDAKVVAANLSPTMRQILAACPDEPFERFGYLKVSRIHDSAVRRGLIESCGKPDRGRWLYRLTEYGRAVRAGIGMAA